MPWAQPDSGFVTLVQGISTLVMPRQFSYIVPSPSKRHVVEQTHGGIRTHIAPDIIPGDTIIPFRIPTIDKSQWFIIREFFQITMATETGTFTGYWGESFTVKWYVLDDPPVSRQIFDVTGAFQIITVISWGSA